MKFALILVLLAGCQAYHPDRPQVADIYRDNLVQKYQYGLPAESYETKDSRNRAIDEIVFLIDDEFAAYEAGIYNEHAAFKTISDIVVMASAATAATASVTAVKTIFAGIATATTGAGATIDKNYFLEQSRLAIITKMEELRTRELVLIEQRKSESITEYTMPEAMNDLLDYYNSGTVLSALQGITQSSSQQLQQQQTDLLQYRRRGH